MRVECLCEELPRSYIPCDPIVAAQTPPSPPAAPHPRPHAACRPPQVSVSTFKGRTYVGVREMYEKGGQLLPGKKGCNMSVAGWRVLLAGEGRGGEIGRGSAGHLPQFRCR